MPGMGNLDGSCWFKVIMDGTAKNEQQWSAYDALCAQAMEKQKRGKKVTVIFPARAKVKNNELTVTLAPHECVCVKWE